METTQTKFGLPQLAIVLLTLATAFIHFSLLFPDTMFILNGLGYLALLAAYFLPLPFFKDNRRLVRWAFLAFTAVTILAWVAIGDKTLPAGSLGYITKVIELILVVFLWSDRSGK